MLSAWALALSDALAVPRLLRRSAASLVNLRDRGVHWSIPWACCLAKPPLISLTRSVVLAQALDELFGTLLTSLAMSTPFLEF
jgi:hypothetical protein